MAKPSKTGTAPVSAPVRPEDDEPIVEVDGDEKAAPVAAYEARIVVPAAFADEVRRNLRAQGVTGEAASRAIAERWAARNR